MQGNAMQYNAMQYNAMHYDDDDPGPTVRLSGVRQGGWHGTRLMQWVVVTHVPPCDLPRGQCTKYTLARGVELSECVGVGE